MEAVATSVVANRTRWAVKFMPKFGEAIYERRDVLGISGPEAAMLSETYAREKPAIYAKFSQQTLSRWESDRTGAIIAASSPARIRSLARVLQWTLEEFSTKVGVPAVGWELVAPRDDAAPTRLVGGLVIVPVVGLANGGRPSEYGLPVEPSLVRGDNTRAFQVEGDSMANAAGGGIRDGNWVLVDTSLTTPVNGRVFLLEIIGDGMTVKRLRRVGDAWIFMSDNPAVGESWREDQVAIVGQVYGRVDFAEIQ